jgi:hypothetical protein
MRGTRAARSRTADFRVLPARCIRDDARGNQVGPARCIGDNARCIQVGPARFLRWAFCNLCPCGIQWEFDLKDQNLSRICTFKRMYQAIPLGYFNYPQTMPILVNFYTKFNLIHIDALSCRYCTVTQLAEYFNFN